MSEAGAHRLQVVFRGRVQGVGFRWTVRRLAEARGVTGWVRNERDGSVRMEAQAAPPTLEALRAAIRDAMPGQIEEEREQTLELQPAESGFAIRPTWAREC